MEDEFRGEAARNMTVGTCHSSRQKTQKVFILHIKHEVEIVLFPIVKVKWTILVIIKI